MVRHREIAGREPDQSACATFTRHADALLERDERWGCDKDTVGAAACLLLQLGRGIRRLCIKGEVGSELLSQGELRVVDVDSADQQAHRLRVLDGKMPQTTAAGDGKPLAGLRLGLLDAFVGGNSGTDQRSRFHRGQPLGDVGYIVRVGEDVLGEAAILGIASESCIRAYGLPSSEAILAVAAGRVEPGHAHTVAFFYDGDAGAHRSDNPDRLMAWNEGWGGLERPIAVRRMDVCMADTAGFSLDDDLTRPRSGHVPLAQHQRLAELFDDRRVHRLCALGGLDVCLGFQYGCTHGFYLICLYCG